MASNAKGFRRYGDCIALVDTEGTPTIEQGNRGGTVPHPKKDIPRGPVASIYRKAGWIMQKEETMRFVFFIHRDDVGYGVSFRNSRAACP